MVNQLVSYDDFELDIDGGANVEYSFAAFGVKAVHLVTASAIEFDARAVR